MYGVWIAATVITVLAVAGMVVRQRRRARSAADPMELARQAARQLRREQERTRRRMPTSGRGLEPGEVVPSSLTDGGFSDGFGGGDGGGGD